MTTEDSRPSFQPTEHLIDIRGTPYLPCAWRIAWFRAEHPDGIIDTKAERLDDQVAIFQALVSIPGSGSATGHGSCQVERATMISGRYIEKAETAAVGRALALLGYGTQFAVSDFDEAEEGVDALPSRQVAEMPKKATPAAQYAEHKAATTTPKGGSGARLMELKFAGVCTECNFRIAAGLTALYD